ncbi:MAG: SdiA-regulated domain-containing protein [Myxococcota bacterium]
MTIGLISLSALVPYLLSRESEAAKEADEREKSVSNEELPELPYRVSEPSETQSLPSALQEISGLVVNPAGGVGWAINDEEGVIFEVDLQTGLVKSNLAFSDRGDYEAIERIGDTLVVARSDGDLFRVRGKKVDRIESPLNREADVEGLAYDAKKSRLLVACKGRIGKKKVYKNARAVFALPWPELTWSETPLFLITENDIEDFLDDFPVPGVDVDRADRFAPSAIAVHPVSGEIYLLSTRARLLLIVDEYGEILSMAGLNRKVHRQPEGLAFDSNGTLYISNEGRGGKATIHRFDPIRLSGATP